MPTLTFHVQPPPAKAKPEKVAAKPKDRITYREDPAYRFMLRLQTRENEPRIKARVFKAKGPEKGREYLTPQVLIGSFEVFARGKLVVESPPEGWASEEQAKLAIVQLLAVQPGDTGVPKNFFDEYTEMQRAFIKDHAPGMKKLLQERFES